MIEGSSAANMTPELANTLSAEEKQMRFDKAAQILKEAGADYVIQAMRELPQVIEQINERLEADAE